MSVLTTFNGTGYLVPTQSELGWSTTVTNLLVDLGSNSTPKALAAISNGTINGTVIGGSAPAAGTFTTLVATNGTITTLSATTTATVPTVTSTDSSTNAASTSFVQTVATPGVNSAGRNKLLNPLFMIQQRGAGAWTGASQFTADRWGYFRVGAGAGSVTIGTASDGTRAAVADEECAYHWSNTWTGSATATDYQILRQSTENVRRLSGKTVTLSFWAQFAGAGTKLGVSFSQYFGTGGSPSATVDSIGATAVTSGGVGTWTRYTVTATLPSISGKTLGSNGDHSTQVILWFSAGASFNNSGVGVQSGTCNLWGMQLEVAGAATAIEKPDPQQDLARCQRHYVTGQINMYAYNTIGNFCTQMISLPVYMRTTPTMTSSLTPGNLTGGTVDAQSAYQVRLVGTATATGPCTAFGSFTASADL